MKAPIIHAIAVLFLMQPGASMASDRCRIGALSSARSAAVRTLRTLELSAPDQLIVPLTEEVAKEACIPAYGLSDTAAAEAAATVMGKFIGNAEKLGRSATIQALVAEAAGGDIGLGRLDFRSFGTLTVVCPASLGDAKVTFEGRLAGNCDTRFLLRAGSVDVEMKNGVSPVCIGRANVRERADISCDCVQAAKTPASMSCR